MSEHREPTHEEILHADETIEAALKDIIRFGSLMRRWWKEQRRFYELKEEAYKEYETCAGQLTDAENRLRFAAYCKSLQDLQP